MSPPIIIRSMGALLFGAALALLTACVSERGRRGDAIPADLIRPNILFVLVDDMGWIDAGYAGSSVYETPEIDRLASDGMVFEQAYVAYPRCVPSRYALMTGRNPARSRIPGGGHLEAEETTIAEALRLAGYRTFIAGKWHLGKDEKGMPEANGFDVNIGGGSAGSTTSYFWPYGAKGALQIGPGLESGQEGEYLTDRLTTETVRFIEDQHNHAPEQPFFALLSHYAVHTPIQAKADLVAHFEEMPATDVQAVADPFLRRDGLTKRFQDDAVYAAMIASVDQSLGALREALERLGVADKTIIVFTSDHGGLSNRGTESSRRLPTSNLPLRAGKGHLYDGGLRVPMIVYWPDQVRAGSVNKDFMVNTDHFPTLLQIAGAALRPSDHLDGESYLPMLQEEGRIPERSFVWYNPLPRPAHTGDTASAAIRAGRWKYFLSYDPDVPSALFDLQNDPGETSDLSGDHPQLASDLRARLEAWLAAADVAPADPDYEHSFAKEFGEDE